MTEIPGRGLEKESATNKKRENIDSEAKKELRFRISGDLSTQLTTVKVKGATGKVLRESDMPSVDVGKNERNVLALMDDQKVDTSSMSLNEKLRMMMTIGNREYDDYDFARSISLDANRITFQQYKENFIKSYKTDKFIEESYGWDKNGKFIITEEKKLEAAGKLSELLKVPAEDIKKLWDESKDVTDFRQRLRDKYLQYGVCRDGAVYKANFLHMLGVEDTFSTTSPNNLGMHAVTGFRDENGNIAFLDYGTLIKTDTPNMKLALKVLESVGGSVGLNYIQSLGAAEGKDVIFVKSKASEVLESIARGNDENLTEEISSTLDKGGLDTFPNFLDLSIDKKRTKIDLNLNTIGGTTIISTSAHYLGADEGNSIDTAYSARVAHEYGNKNARIGLGTAYTNIKLKDPEIENLYRVYIAKDKEPINKFLTTLYSKFHADVEINPQVRYKIAAMTELIVDIGLDKGGTLSSYQLDFGAEHQLFFIFPNLDMYIGAQHVHSLTTDNLTRIPQALDELSLTNDLLAVNLGGDVKLGEWSGYKVNFNFEGQAGVQSLRAKEYSGKAGVKVTKDEFGVVTEVKGKYVDSNDFRINEFGQIEASIGVITPVDGGTLHVKGYGFDSKTHGEFKDLRLDEWGVGFNIDYNF